VSDECELSTYGQMVEVIENLGFLVREKRRERRQSIRAAAAEAGLAPSTIHRLENGTGVSQDGLAALLRWLDTSPLEEEA